MNPYAKMTAAQLLAHVMKNQAKDEEDAGHMLAHLAVLAEEHSPPLATLLTVLADMPIEISAIYARSLAGLIGREETSRAEVDIINAAVAVLGTPEHWT